MYKHIVGVGVSRQRVLFCIEKVGHCHHQVLSRARVVDHAPASRASGS